MKMNVPGRRDQQCVARRRCIRSSKRYAASRLLLRPSNRCILMTTDPGDLVFDPTCGSGTTAYVAEQVGTPLDHLRHLPRSRVPWPSSG